VTQYKSIIFKCTLIEALRVLDSIGINHYDKGQSLTEVADVAVRSWSGGLHWNEVGHNICCGAPIKETINLIDLVKTYSKKDIRLSYTCSHEEAIKLLVENNIFHSNRKEDSIKELQNVGKNNYASFPTCIQYFPKTNTWLYKGYDGKDEVMLDINDLITQETKKNSMVVFKKVETIAAMKQLICEYAKGTHKPDFKSCVLCNIHLKNRAPCRDNCSECPWVVITGKNCTTQLPNDNLGRVVQLTEWIKQYEESKDYEYKKPFEPIAITITLDSLEKCEYWYSLAGNSNNTRFPESEAIYNSIRSKVKAQDYTVTCNPKIDALASSKRKEWATLIDKK
jgi:hypothetical protein